MSSHKILLILFAANALGMCIATNIYSRTITWDNYQEMLEYGWTSANTTTSYQKPSELHPTLMDLNKNTTGVWGWRNTGASGDFMQFKLDLGKRPEHCGLIYASLQAKYFLTKPYGDDESFIRPGYNCYYAGCFTYIRSSDNPIWQNFEWELNWMKEKVITVRFTLNRLGAFLIDNFSLTYVVKQNDKNCPSSCDGKCRFKALDCHNYYSCVNGTERKFYTCNSEDGLAFNPITESCDLIENVEECDPAKRPPPPAKCDCEYRPHEENNTMYYYCDDTCHPETCEEKACPSGLEWSKDAETGLYQCAPDGFLAF